MTLTFEAQIQLKEMEYESAKGIFPYRSIIVFIDGNDSSPRIRAATIAKQIHVKSVSDTNRGDPSSGSN